MKPRTIGPGLFGLSDAIIERKRTPGYLRDDSLPLKKVLDSDR